MVPAERGSSGLPGTANTSRPCSPANRAVISEPDRSAASTTTTPSEIPEFRQLWRGESFPRGEKPGARSLIRSPCSPIERCSSSFLPVDIVNTAGKKGNSATRKCGKVSCGVDATGETRGDDEAFMS